MPSPSFDSDIERGLSRGPTSALQLMQALSVSQSTLSRALRSLERQQRVLRMGSTRGTRYALRRPIARIGSYWPIYRIDAEGNPQPLGTLNAIQQDSYYVAPDSLERIQGLFDGLPYYLQDARPAGFLGRALPGAFPELALPPRVADWTDEHFLTYLVQRGTDTTGDLITGVAALNRFLAGQQEPSQVRSDERLTAYPALATAAMAGAPPGSSAQGEHPKFTACLSDGGRHSHVIVKFSPPASTQTGRRWADLLIAEHRAHRLLEEQDIQACRSNLLHSGDRVFLECERFDRIGASGRRGAVTLFAIETARYGKLDSWTASADRLAAESLLSFDDAQRIRFLDAFGALTANSDRHFGNVTLFDRYQGSFELAPVYDMLPMLFAPQDEQLVARQFEPVPPRAEWLAVWPQVCHAAEAYWTCLADDARLSREFRALSTSSLAALRAMPRRAPRKPAGPST